MVSDAVSNADKKKILKEIKDIVTPNLTKLLSEAIDKKMRVAGVVVIILLLGIVFGALAWAGHGSPNCVLGRLTFVGKEVAVGMVVGGMGALVTGLVMCCSLIHSLYPLIKVSHSFE